MEVPYKEAKTITALNVQAPVGSFALDKTPFHFETCRERFAKSWNSKTLGLFFKTDSGAGSNVAAFMLKTELVLQEKSHTQFAPTNWDDILWIEPVKFWMKCSMRRSLFTILIRAGLAYRPEQDNYEDALFRQKYLADTPAAIKRFLYGYTNYVGPPPSGSSTLETGGWRTVFYDKDSRFVKEALKAPRKKPCVVGYDLPDALWV